MAYYVYELFDPRTDRVFYVGKGKGRRIDAHEVEALAGRQSRKCALIREIIAAGHSIGKRKVKHFHCEQEAFDYEAELVEFVGLDRLTNLIPGGGTARGIPSVYSDRLRVRAAAELINRTGNGKIAGVLVAGQYLDLKSIIQSMTDAVFAVASRRSVEWVNAIAKRYRVEFSHG